MENENQNFYLVPGAIIAAGLLIAGAIIYSQGTKSPLSPAALTENKTEQSAGSAERNQNQEQEQEESGPSAGPMENIKPVDSKDHIRGNPGAMVKLVEFSDMECPFCRQFHQTLKEAMEEYGQDGRLAWIYRHFPIVQLHFKAPKEAEATECANELGGHDKFWEYLDKIFAITPSNNNLDLKLLPQVAEDVDLERQKFEECLESGKYAGYVQSNLEDAVNSGGQGTPYSIVIAPNGKKFGISGAQPYSAVKRIIDLALLEQ